MRSLILQTVADNSLFCGVCFLVVLLEADFTKADEWEISSWGCGNVF